MSQNNFQEQLLGRLEKLEKLVCNAEQLSKENEKFNNRFTSSQRAKHLLFSLNFGLITSTTLIPAVSAVLKR